MSPTIAIASAIEAARCIPLADSAYSTLSDNDLLELTRQAARLQSLAATLATVLAGEISRRSAPALGQSGLAQRTGHRTPQELVRVTTGSTAREASSAVRVGSLTETHPWEIRAAKAWEYWLVPPPEVDPRQTPRAMPTSSRAMRELQRAG